MNSRCSAFAVALLFAVCASSTAGVTQVNNPAALNANGTTDWGTLGPLGTSQVPPKTVSVSGITGLTLTASMYQMDAEFSLFSAEQWGRAFTAGVRVLWTGANNTGLHAPMDLILSRPVYGIGFHIDNNYWGGYTATMAVYDSKDTLLATYTVQPITGAGNAAAFLGALSTDLNIKRVTITATASSQKPGDTNDFAIDSPIINGQSIQQPTITALTNNYSYIQPGLPNYGIAQGSIFLIYGFKMGPTNLVTQGFPLQKTLGGVQINVTVGGTTTQAIPYYVSASQIAAILASATPVGDGTITVTYNGQTSAAVPIHVVASALGILAVTGANGMAQATDTQYRLLGYTNSANPQDIVTFWGSGLGAVTGDETNVGTPVRLSNIALEVYMGGQKADVQWAGRSAFPGLDQVNVYVPPGVAGCNVGVFFKVGNMVANAVSIPVAAAGRECPGTVADLNGAAMQSLVDASPVKVGLILPTGIRGYPGGSFDVLAAGFGLMDFRQITTYQTYFQQVFYGSCQVHTVGTDYEGDETVPYPTMLDAGTPMIVAVNPGGSFQIAPTLRGFYYAQTDRGTTFIPTGANSSIMFSFPGGKDIGATSTTMPLGAPATWTNMNSFGTIDRTQPLTVIWSNAAANSWVIITGSSYLPDPISPLVTTFACLAHGETGTFTVPSYVLAALPPTAATFPMPSSLSLQNASQPMSFKTTGVPLSMLQASVIYWKQVTYK